MMSSQSLYAYANKFSSAEWLNILVKSIDQKEIDGIIFPSFPDDAIQSNFVGSSNEHALTEAYVFYNIIQDVLKREKTLLNMESKVLDFGCGWGRFARFFYRDVYYKNLYLLDPWEMIINLCRENNVYGQLLNIDLLPPLIIKDNTFDLIFGYSVFSHLSERAANLWIEELTRVLKPGGHIIITTQGRTFIDFCKNMRNKQSASAWEQSLANSFVNEAGFFKKYDNGEFLYAANGGGEALPDDIYGDTLIPYKYVKKNWTSKLQLMDFVDDREKLPQAYMVFKK
jgi:SAM-dependent methyltransferase